MATDKERREVLRPLIDQRDELLRLFYAKRQHWGLGKAKDLHSAILLICQDGGIACDDWQTVKMNAAPIPPKAPDHA